ncbi:hypothetical protein LNN31_08155 [Acetobacterium wieringae]|uniref:Uncharacterized protein n=1 Tax=Acetobacterium wieringae TaxID=52694 RepID=A0ABY6HLB2_9FIRM|nr:hypothetical protein [Acetobacterium wieringae]UYO64381.1 hypothetical protein LNN31_08155 [Acetobacterium wieringae]VUZ26993.1 Uncharacterised protein [Acetobacterium wieringae]
MNNLYADYMQEQKEDVKTDQVRKDIEITLTDKQYSNLKLKAYQAGFKNAGDFIQSFVSDLTGWCSNGSDERDLADQWYQRAHGMSEFYYYFHFFLFNYDYMNLVMMSELLVDEDYFEAVYEEYTEQAWGQDVQSREECLELLKELVKADVEL